MVSSPEGHMLTLNLARNFASLLIMGIAANSCVELQ